jgi:hypothetical protein
MHTHTDTKSEINNSLKQHPFTIPYYLNEIERRRRKEDRCVIGCHKFRDLTFSIKATRGDMKKVFISLWAQRV